MSQSDQSDRRMIGGVNRIGSLSSKVMLYPFLLGISSWSHCHIGAAEIFFDALGPSDGSKMSSNSM